jgi:hypothetical protein
MTDSKPKLRWFQYSLRTLLVFVTLSAVPCSWLGWKIRQAERQRKAAAAIGGEVVWSKPIGPVWLRRLLVDGLFMHVESVDLSGQPDIDAKLKNLQRLNQLQTLSLFWESDFTDAGLENLKGLKQLQALGLWGTDKVTDAGLENLKGLDQLTELDLIGNFTDAGLENLKALDHLRELMLGSDKFTDAGLENLEGLSQLENLTLLGTGITDAGLEHLNGLHQLKTLSLGRTKVTKEGVKKLRQALPNCEVDDNCRLAYP